MQINYRSIVTKLWLLRKPSHRSRHHYIQTISRANTNRIICDDWSRQELGVDGVHFHSLTHYQEEMQLDLWSRIVLQIIVLSSHKYVIIRALALFAAAGKDSRRTPPPLFYFIFYFSDCCSYFKLAPRQSYIMCGSC